MYEKKKNSSNTIRETECINIRCGCCATMQKEQHIDVDIICVGNNENEMTNAFMCK